MGIKWDESSLRFTKQHILFTKNHRRRIENDIKRMDPTYRIVKAGHKLKPDNKMKVNMKKITNQLVKPNKLKQNPGYCFIYTHPNTKEPCDAKGKSNVESAMADFAAKWKESYGFDVELAEFGYCKEHSETFSFFDNDYGY